MEDTELKYSRLIAGACIYPVNLITPVNQVPYVNLEFVLWFDQSVMGTRKVLGGLSRPFSSVGSDVNDVLWDKPKAPQKREEIVQTIGGGSIVCRLGQTGQVVPKYPQRRLDRPLDHHVSSRQGSLRFLSHYPRRLRPNVYVHNSWQYPPIACRTQSTRGLRKEVRKYLYSPSLNVRGIHGHQRLRHYYRSVKNRPRRFHPH